MVAPVRGAREYLARWTRLKKSPRRQHRPDSFQQCKIQLRIAPAPEAFDDKIGGVRQGQGVRRSVTPAADAMVPRMNGLSSSCVSVTVRPGARNTTEGTGDTASRSSNESRSVRSPRLSWKTPAFPAPPSNFPARPVRRPPREHAPCQRMTGGTGDFHASTCGSSGEGRRIIETRRKGHAQMQHARPCQVVHRKLARARVSTNARGSQTAAADHAHSLLSIISRSISVKR
jgi:hypothetical protein